MNYAQMRDLYHRSFGDDVLRQRFLLFLSNNRELKKLHSIFADFFFPDDFRMIGIEPYAPLVAQLKKVL